MYSTRKWAWLKQLSIEHLFLLYPLELPISVIAGVLGNCVIYIMRWQPPWGFIPAERCMIMFLELANRLF